MTTTEFATAVLTAANASPTGRYGDSLVYVAHLWRQYNRQNAPVTLDSFKAALLQANRRDRLRLRGADLMNDKDPADLQESAIPTTFHPLYFVDTSFGR